SARSARGTPWKRMPRSTFSRTVFQGNSAFSWNTKAMSRGIGPATGLPCTSTVPAVGARSPPLPVSGVLFPQADGPIRQIRSPRAISNEVSSSGLTARASPSSPKRCDTRLMRMAVSMRLARAARRLRLRQELLGIELAHVRLVRQEPDLNEGTGEHIERLGLEPTVETEDRHDLI